MKVDEPVYVCDVCGVSANWSEEWQHYGSIKVDEDCGHRVDTCSTTCRNTVRAMQLIQEFERNHRASASCRVGKR